MSAQLLNCYNKILFQEILINIDELKHNQVSESEIFDTSVKAGLRWGDFKLITGEYLNTFIT